MPEISPYVTAEPRHIRQFHAAKPGSHVRSFRRFRLILQGIAGRRRLFLVIRRFPVVNSVLLWAVAMLVDQADMVFVNRRPRYRSEAKGS